MRLYLTDTSACITEESIRTALAHDANTIFIVPEPAKAQVERSVLKHVVEEGVPDGIFIQDKTNKIPVSAGYAGGDIVSFLRLAVKILEATGDMSSSGHTEVVMRNAVYAVLAQYHDEFTTFSNLTGRSDNINKLISLIGDFVRYNVTPKEIEKAIEADKGEDSQYLNKLRDIKLLMERVEEISDKYDLGLMQDPILKASKVLAGLDKVKLTTRRYRKLRILLDRSYAVLQFGVTRNLTPGEYALVEALDRLSRSVDIYINGSEEKSGIPLYSCSGSVVDRFKAYGAEIVKLPVADYRTADLGRMTEGYSEGIMGPCGVTNSKDIRLYEITGNDNRIGLIMEEIVRLVSEEGLRFRDIRICCCDDALINSIRPVAARCGLDVFIDRKITLNNTVVPRFVMLLLRLPITGFALGDVLALLRSGMYPVHPGYCDVFENYCVRYNITDAARMFNENNYKTDPKESHPMKNYIERGTADGYGEGIYTTAEFVYKHIVERILLPVRKVALEVDGRKDMAGKAEVLLDYMDSIREYTELLVKELDSSGRSDVAQATVRAYDETMSILASFTHEMNRVEISQRNFLELFRTDMMNKTSGTIPLKVDSVEITTPDHAYYTSCKILFIVGATRENFPYKKTSDGIMSSYELKTLAQDITVTLPDKNVVKTREEFITSALMLASASDRIYMIHEQGQGKSRVFEYMANCVDKSDILINNYLLPVEGSYTPRNYKFESATISPEFMKVLLSDGLSVSVSTLEKYISCPVEFMLTKILNIRTREDNREIRANVFGTLAHSIFEESMKKICAEYDTPEKMAGLVAELTADPAKLDKLTEEMLALTISKEKIPGSLDDDGSVNRLFNSNQGNKLRRLFRFMFVEVLFECAESGYVPSGYELDISKPPYLMEYSVDGYDFRFTGSVDRMDLSADDPDVFRIQDYKTYGKSFSAHHLINGIQIQLPAYALAVKNGRPGSRVSNFGYTLVQMKPGDGKAMKLVQKNANLSDEDIDTALKYTEYIIRKTLHDIASGKSDSLYLGDKKGSSYLTMMGLTGNPGSNPKKRDEITVEKGKGFEKMKEIMKKAEDKDNE